MMGFEFVLAWLARVTDRGDDDSERGDVPGWVMVTVMSAGLVVVIFGVFKAKITDAVSNAIDSVTGATGN
jgi:Na+/H+ antiporter NhaD/arsenite permease-like protein